MAMMDKASIAQKIIEVFSPIEEASTTAIVSVRTAILLGWPDDNPSENFFVGKRWQDLSLQDLILNIDDFWLLNSLGFYLFLPAYLFVLFNQKEAEESEILIAVANFICPWESRLDIVSDSLYLFSDSQKQLIKHIIKNYTGYFSDYEIEDNLRDFSINLWSWPYDYHPSQPIIKL
jgi:hypothetical protein